MLTLDIVLSTRLVNHMTDYISPDTTDPDECMELMVNMMKAASDLHMATNYPMLNRPVFGFMKGKKYARFWSDNGTQRYVCFFVDMSTGDVWKADGWKKPALNFVRGNIFTKKGRVAIIGDRTTDSAFHYYHAF